MSKKYVKRGIEWPTAYEVARLIVEAARIEGEDAVAVLNGKRGSHARVYAFIALMHRFPTVNATPAMRMCGAPFLTAFTASISAQQIARGDLSKHSDWFSVEKLNAIVEACGWPRMTRDEVEVRRLPKRSGTGAEQAQIDARETEKPNETAPIAVAPSGPEIAAAPPAARLVGMGPGLRIFETDEGVVAKHSAESDLQAEDAEAVVDLPAAPVVSDAARALASLARSRAARQVASAAPRPEFSDASLMASRFRPDRPAAERGVSVLPPEFFGDPAPGRSALDQRNAAPVRTSRFSISAQKEA